MEVIKIQKRWKLELGSQAGMIVLTWNVIGFQQLDREDSQDLNIDTFCILPVASTQCTKITEKHPDAAILLKYDDEIYFEGYG